MWMHDPAKNWACHEQGGKKMRRRGPAPCRICPKESPEDAHRFELSPRNMAAVRHYLAHRAMNFNALSDIEKQDAIVQRNFEIIDHVYRELDTALERAYENQRMAVMLTAAKGATKR